MRFRKKAIFGNNIVVNCEYCEHSINNKQGNICTLNRSIKRNKCRKFKYDPLKRIPKGVSLKQSDFSPEEFKL